MICKCSSWIYSKVFSSFQWWWWNLVKLIVSTIQILFACYPDRVAIFYPCWYILSPTFCSKFHSLQFNPCAEILISSTGFSYIRCKIGVSCQIFNLSGQKYGVASVRSDTPRTILCSLLPKFHQLKNIHIFPFQTAVHSL